MAASTTISILGLHSNKLAFASRSLHTSYRCLVEQDWRYKNGMPRNPNAYGPLTDGKDFTFIDGRSTPLGHGQYKRLVKHQELAAKVVQTVKEMDFAVARHARLLKEKEEQVEKILSGKLKPKGHHLLSKK